MTEENKPLYPSVCPVPFMKHTLFAQLTGFSEGTVKGWIADKEIDVIKVGKHNAINLVVITQKCLDRLATLSDKSSDD